MKLVKFPVVTKTSRYKVVIEFRNYTYVVYVYKEPSNFLQKLIPTLLDKRYYDWSSYFGEYIKMAEDAVQKYEYFLDRRMKRKKKSDSAVAEWNAWSGVVKEE